MKSIILFLLQLADDVVIFKSKEYEDVREGMRELDFHEPLADKWQNALVFFASI